jgi:hypothetical protein
MLTYAGRPQLKLTAKQRREQARQEKRKARRAGGGGGADGCVSYADVMLTYADVC